MLPIYCNSLIPLFDELCLLLCVLYFSDKSWWKYKYVMANLKMQTYLILWKMMAKFTKFWILLWIAQQLCYTGCLYCMDRPAGLWTFYWLDRPSVTYYLNYGIASSRNTWLTSWLFCFVCLFTIKSCHDNSTAKTYVFVVI